MSLGNGLKSFRQRIPELSFDRFAGNRLGTVADLRAFFSSDCAFERSGGVKNPVTARKRNSSFVNALRHYSVWRVRNMASGQQPLEMVYVMRMPATVCEECYFRG